MSELIVKTIRDYLDAIDLVAARYASPERKSELVFRGLSNYEHKLIPSAYRAILRDGVMVPRYGSATENEILHHFIKNAMSVVDHIDRDDLLTWLTYAQHFGAPTRLLDFSANPLISLYFSCKQERGGDGGVCILHEKSYVRSLNLGATPGRTKRDVLLEILENIAEPRRPCTAYPVTFIPHYIDNRMEAQGSRFLVWGSDRSPFESMAEPYGDMLRGDKGAFFCKLRIDGAAKGRLLRELSFLGVNEKKLFPGLDGIGKYIAGYYDHSGDK